MRIRETRLDLDDGAQLALEERGTPGDPVVLLLSGAAASRDWWPPGLCDRLARSGRRVVRYDHRDTGASTCDPPGAPRYGGDRLRADALAVVEHLGPEPVHLVGVSMGGGIAQSLALRHPERVASLTVVASSPLGFSDLDGESLPGPLPAVAATFEAPVPDPDWTDRDAVVAWYLDGERAFAGRLGVDEAGVRVAVEATLDRTPSPASAGNHWLVVGRDDADGPPLDAHDLSVPTLVVHGSDDPLFPLPHGRALAAAVTGAELLVLDGMGHQVPPAASWDEFVPVVLEHTAR